MAHPDLNALLGTLLPFGRDMVQKYGGVNPHGIQKTTAGDVQLVGADPTVKTVRESFDLLYSGFRSRKERLQAVGVVYSGHASRGDGSPETPAIIAELEHASGEAVNVFLPYTHEDGQTRFGEIFASARAVEVFG